MSWVPAPASIPNCLYYLTTSTGPSASARCFSYYYLVLVPDENSWAGLPNHWDQGSGIVASQRLIPFQRCCRGSLTSSLHTLKSTQRWWEPCSRWQLFRYQSNPSMAYLQSIPRYWCFSVQFLFIWLVGRLRDDVMRYMHASFKLTHLQYLDRDSSYCLVLPACKRPYQMWSHREIDKRKRQRFCIRYCKTDRTREPQGRLKSILR